MEVRDNGSGSQLPPSFINRDAVASETQTSSDTL
jgi:hypothetical protein